MTRAAILVPALPTAPQEEEAAKKEGGGPSFLIPILLVVAIFYVVMIGPERKQRKKREEMLKALKKGDRIMTTGGMLASVAQVQDDVVTLQVADGVRVRYTRQAIQSVLDEDGKAAPDSKGDAKGDSKS